MHGAAGTVGSDYRVPSYRALSAGDPRNIHVLTLDYQGFGRSPGVPSEQGPITDVISVVEWAMNTAGIPQSRIIIFGHSMGAVTLAISEHFALRSPPVSFASAVLMAPYCDTSCHLPRSRPNPPLISTSKIFLRFQVSYHLHTRHLVK